MILVAIELENYKQYAGTTKIDFPPEGIVAITGANGAGKTTLFEAIEWCLYCPRAIAQGSIPPHDGIGKTVVRLTLEDEQDGKRYTVVRELRGSGTRAEVFDEDEPWQPMVQGTREVTQFVARKLVGLAHNAFISTFFTKQRELQMFGSMSPTDRRVEVAKLLGLEAVREAQHQIGEGRTAARALADARRAEYDRRIAGRDLDRELEEAAEQVREHESAEVDANARLQQAHETALRARAAFDAQRDLQERDARLQHSLAAEAAMLAKAKAHLDASTREIARLEQRASERVRLLALANHVSGLESEVANLEQERSRFEVATRLRDAEQRAIEAAIRVSDRLRTLIDDHVSDAAGLLAWKWSAFEVAECDVVSRQVSEAIAALDVRSMQARLEAMQQAVQRDATVSEIDRQLIRYREFLERLEGEYAALVAPGDPDQVVAVATTSVTDARNNEKREQLALAKVRDDIAATRQLVLTLREHEHAAVCPTCTRPLSAGEVDQLIEALSPRLRELETDVANLETAVAMAGEQVVTAVAKELEARSRIEEARILKGRLQDGATRIRETEAQRDEAHCSFRRLLKHIEFSQAPASHDIEQARITAERAQRIASLAGTVRSLGEQAREAHFARLEAQTQLSSLGVISFDADALRSAVNKLQSARRAAAQIEQIDVELALRDAYERERKQSEDEIARGNEAQAKLTVEREAIGFDPGELNAAQHADLEARNAVDARREAHSTALQEARDAMRARDRVIEEASALQRLVTEADAHEREADELTRMYEEFREFDRYVARQVGPLLAESTERMLGHVTNGKFDQVQFDENYGIEIFDGDEAFPMTSFSGGERDVVALCARLALSEIVGSAALRPPRFLVLDEVFGSLDSDRRAQLLEMLGGLARSGYFRQMFIISHVDDVQQSPVMTEAWRIEDNDGVSRVIHAGITGA